MIELPDKFKQALGGGVRTSLYPLVRIYKGIKIHDSITDDVESINLSIKETNIDGIAYKPLLLNSPSIKSSADIINNKYTISSVSLSISNAPFQGKIFSDEIQSLLNTVCEIYYCSNGIDSINDCLLVYTGTIRRFSQSAENIKLELEDLTEQKLSIKIPSTLIDDTTHYSEETIGKPYPMVYGYVDNSPLITRSQGLQNDGELSEKVSELHIDKKGKKIGGLIEVSTEETYGHSFLTESHPLINNGFLNNVGASLSVYEGGGFLPIQKEINVEQWEYDGNSLSDHEVYYFQQAHDEDTSASITINSNAFIKNGLPTRIFRPLDKIECQTQNETYGNHNSINRIYGFTGYSRGQVGNWKPWEYSQNVVDTDEDSPYDDNWNNGNQTWWEPTACNSSRDSVKTTSIDENWVNYYPDTNGLFPIENLQDGESDSGIYLCCRNAQGLTRSGWVWVKFIYKDDIGSFPCTTKLIYDADYHSFHSMDADKRPYGARWMRSYSPVGDTDYGAGYPWNGCVEAKHLIELNPGPDTNIDFTNYWPGIPSNIDDGEWTSDSGSGQWFETAVYGNSQDDTEKTIRTYFHVNTTDTINDTSDLDARLTFQQYPTPSGGSLEDDRWYGALQLFNLYMLQDTIITQSFDRDFYGKVAGRVRYGYDLDQEMQLGNASHHIFYSILEFLEPHNLTPGNKFELYRSDGSYKGKYEVDIVLDDFEIRVNYKNLGDCDNGHVLIESYHTINNAQDIFKDILEDELSYEGSFNTAYNIEYWDNSFTLHEQKEAKEVFEGLSKSSLIIPSFNADGQFKFIPLHQTLEEEDINSLKIDSNFILKYSFSLTKIDDIKNQINIKYKKNYASGDFDKQTGYAISNNINNYDEATSANYPDNPEFHYNIDYYGLTSEEAKLDVETEYIRDEATAIKLQQRLLHWYANQHLIVKIDLPASYMQLEVGDYIQFNELIGGKLAFGYDYTKHIIKNGQVVYKHFFINKINKTVDKVSIEAIQVHRGQFGVWDGWDEDVDDTFSGGNSGQQNFEQGDPFDYGNYTNDDEEEDYTEEESYLNTFWINGDNNLNNNPQALVDTNIEGQFEYGVYILHNNQELTDENGEVLIPVVEEGTQYNASNYINVSTEVYTNQSGNIQGGKIILSTQYLIPEEHDGITGILKIFYQGTEYSVDLDFAQHYYMPPPPILGDANNDGILNILDAVSMLYVIRSGYETMIEFIEENSHSDMNGDGILNIQDIIILLNIILSGDNNESSQ